jgi:hypothetical protein
MAIPLFLAMTGWEISKAEKLPQNIAWMACHFSPYGTGLTNLPKTLPPGSMLIVNDRTPVCGHDPERIVSQLGELVETHQCSNILLDFQRPDEPDLTAIVKAIVQTMNCPVGVSHYYAEGLSCPVFLPPIPPHIPLSEYVAPWQGRQIWMECAMDGTRITVTDNGSTITPMPRPDDLAYPHLDAELCCHYRIDLTEKEALFFLRRTPDNLISLLDAAEGTNVIQAVGLYQELGTKL